MLYTTGIKNLTQAYPKLSRVWFKGNNARMPLKSVWIDEAKLHRTADEVGAPMLETDSAEVPEDHLVFVA